MWIGLIASVVLSTIIVLLVIIVRLIVIGRRIATRIEWCYGVDRGSISHSAITCLVFSITRFLILIRDDRASLVRSFTVGMGMCRPIGWRDEDVLAAVYGAFGFMGQLEEDSDYVRACQDCGCFAVVLPNGRLMPHRCIGNDQCPSECYWLNAKCEECEWKIRDGDADKEEESTNQSEQEQ